MDYDFDLIVIGSGPAGQKAAIQAAKLGKRVAIAEKERVGGVSVNWGTIPSKTLREAIVYLTGLSQRSTYGESYRVKEEITIEDLRHRTRHVIEREVDIVRNQLMRNHVHLLEGTAVLRRPPHDRDRRRRSVTTEFVVIACGTTPARPAEVDFDEKAVLDSDGLLLLDRIPGSLVVVGAGVIGIEFASMFAALGSKVTVVEKRPGRCSTSATGRSSRGSATTCATWAWSSASARRWSPSTGTRPGRLPTWRAASASSPTSSSTRPAARARSTRCTSRTQGSRPTRAARSRSARTSAPRSTTSSRRAT